MNNEEAELLLLLTRALGRLAAVAEVNSVAKLLLLLFDLDVSVSGVDLTDALEAAGLGDSAGRAAFYRLTGEHKILVDLFIKPPARESKNRGGRR